MYDEDIDRNGIPDMIQRDPVVVPEPFDLFGDPPDDGLPGITAPIEAPEPIEPPPAEVPQAPVETHQEVLLNTSRVANKAADELDGYIRD
jgi:hypothetical protein